jgi:L-threonylcarbamoyladenylate synthase
VEVILDGGPAGVGVESTVLDLTGPYPVVLRPGGLPVEELRRVVGRVEIDPGLARKAAAGAVAPKAPGMKYTHYAPVAPLTLVVPAAGASGQLAPRTWETVAAKLASGAPGEPVGLLASHETLPYHQTRAAAAGVTLLRGNLREAPPTIPRTTATILALDLGSTGEPAHAAAALFAALRWFDAAEVKAIVAESFPETGLGYAVMNRLRKAASEVCEG